MTSDDTAVHRSAYPELRVRLILRGSGFNPDEITQRLGIQPTRVWRAGERTSPRRNPAKVDGWILMVGPRTGFDFKEQVDELLQSVLPLAPAVRALRDALNLTVEVSCVAFVEDVVPALYFTPEQLEAVIQLGATIDIDFMLVSASREAADELDRG